jgi:hypothetical protein
MHRVAILGCVASFAVSIPLAPSFAETSTPRSGAHVYLFRGFMNVFSLGMDEFGNALVRRGIPANVYTHLSWRGAADDAAQRYKQGKLRTIMVMGHSMGTPSVIGFVERLGEYGVPVALAVTLDGSAATVSAGRVNRFVNLYISTGIGGPVSKGAKFSGTISNIDVSKMRDIGHLNIHSQAAIHKMLMGYVNQAVAGGRAAPAAASGPMTGGNAVPKAAPAAPATKPATPPAAVPSAPPAAGGGQAAVRRPAVAAPGAE